jgi:hypothetical protein
MLGLFFDHEDGGDVPLKRWLTINKLHGVISWNTELFVTTTVRISNPRVILSFEDSVIWHV